MKIIAVIPARYASTRFPAKLMQDLGGKTVIFRTYEAAVNTNLFDDVFVVTDSDLIVISQYSLIVGSEFKPEDRSE
jgi:3-deoxy-manno-octulosonate cytidylyltransferase (CMP-KDO synthetase)